MFICQRAKLQQNDIDCHANIFQFQATVRRPDDGFWPVTNNDNDAGVFRLRRLHQNEGERVIKNLCSEVAFTVYSERY